VWKPGTVILRTKSLVLLRNHYYSPVPDPADVAAPGYWERRSTMPGIDLGAERARHLLDRVFPPLVQAFRTALPNVERSGSGDGFYLINGVYMAVDAHVYWAMIHHLRPRRILEIGSGMSTLVALEAVRALGREGIATELTCVEPFPSQFLRDLAGQGALTLLEQPVQEIPLERFTGLEANDILFIDSTHVLREGSISKCCRAWPRVSTCTCTTSASRAGIPAPIGTAGCTGTSSTCCRPTWCTMRARKWSGRGTT
jgi:hypothetical protein